MTDKLVFVAKDAKEILVVPEETPIVVVGNDDASELVQSVDDGLVLVLEENVEQINTASERGPMGPAGPQGPSGDKSYTHNQLSASLTWTINHNLGKYPSITLQDSAGSEFEARIQHVNNNQAIAYLSYAVSGTAHAN